MGGLRTRRNTAIKVMLGLLLPPYILALEFKSREELSLMPQTLEEYLVDHEDTDTSSNSSSSDGSSSSSSSDSDSDSTESDDNFSRFERDSVFKPKKQRVHRRSRKKSPKLVDDDEDVDCDAVGGGGAGRRAGSMAGTEKDVRKRRRSRQDSGTASSAATSHPSKAPMIISTVEEEMKILENGSIRQVSTPTASTDENHKKRFYAFSQLLKHKKKSSLKMGKKFYEFYTAPIAKFWSYTIAYLVMMAMYIYVAMVPTPERSLRTKSWNLFVLVADLQL